MSRERDIRMFFAGKSSPADGAEDYTGRGGILVYHGEDKRDLIVTAGVGPSPQKVCMM